MSMQQKRDDLGKLLACFLVSRKGDSTIYELERDYKENEGRPIPYRDFGCISVLDFLRSIPDHVRLSPSNGTHLVFPVVSEKIKHVNDLVVKQRAAKKSCSSRRKTSKPSRYCPRLREPSPFIPNNVQKEIASILTREPNGVKKDYIVQYLQNSRSIAGTVDLTNVDDYLTSMSHIAYTRGNMVFPSLSLHVTSNVAQHNTQPPNRPEAGKSNMSETPQPMMSINSTPVMNTYPAGAEEDEDMFYDDEFGDEEIRLHCASMGNYKVDTDNQPQQSSWTSLEQGVGRMSSAEFIARGAGSYEQRQSQTNTLHLRNNNIDEEAMNELTYSTYASDDEEFDIINDRLKSRLQQLIQKHPDGIWCADLPQTFLDEYSVPLDYAELGFQSVCDLASRLPSIFHLCRWDNRGDFILYDATEPVPTNIKKTDFDEQDSDWADAIDDDYEDIDPIPPTLDLQESQKLIPHDVMSHGESVGQQRIPEFPSDGCVHHLEVFVSEVYTPSLFWVHLRKKRLKLGQLMENMHEFYQREGLNYTIPTVILEKGLNCVCMFEDKWHRAIIKTVKPDGDVTLIFYDYGTTKTYPSEDVRFLHRLFSNLPAQSIPCGLYNIRPLKHDAWTRGASSDFWDKVADIPLVAIVNKVDRENNSMLISLVDTREQTDDHINDWMVHKGLAEFGSMGDTVALESSYLDDRKIDLQETIKGTENVPLISPQSILLESSAKSVRPPPGFTKPLEPSDFAALVSEYLSGKDYTSTEMGNSPFFNSSDANENNNPIVPPSEAIMELLKKPWEIYLQLTTIFHQLLLQNVNVHTTNQTMQNTSCTTASPSTTKNSDMQRSTTNPFQTYQENNNEDLATTINGCAASSDYSTNVNTDEPNLPCFTSSTPFSNSDKTASGSNKDSNFRTFDAQKFLHEEQVFPAKNDNHPPAMLNSTHVNSHSFGIGYLNESLSNGGPTIFYDKNSNLPATGQSNVQNESHDIKTANECTSCHFSKLTENEHSIHVNNGNEFSTPEKNESYKNTFSNANQKIIGTNCVNSDENGAFTKWEFHDTNPFKEYVTTNFSHNIKTEKEESFAEKSINVIEKPPIPPRNPKLINKTVIACKDKIKEVKCDQSTDVGTVLNKPTSNVYYKSGPVMYDIQQNETNTKNDERSEQTPVSTTLVKQSTIKLKQERLANLRQRIAAKMTSVLPPEKENMDQNFTKQEEVLPDVEQNVPRLLSWSKQHQETYHLDEISQGSSETPVSGRTTCEMKIELDNCTGARNKEICNRKERHNKYSTTPNQESPRTSVNGQNLFKNGNANCENSNQHVTLNNNNNLEFCDTKDINTSPDVIPYHLQLQFINLNPHLPHSYGQQHYGSNYPYRAQQPHIMQHPPVIQQLPLFRPSAPRFYTHASNWHRPPFVNPAPNYQFTNIPYAHQYSQSWNPYHNSRFYIPNQTNQTPRVPLGASTTKSPSNTGVDFDKKKLSSRLNDSQIPPHQAKANINIGQHSQMSGEISEFSSYDTTQSDSSGFTEYTEHSKNSNGPEAPIDSHSNRSSEYDNCDLSTHLGKLSLSTDNHDVTKNGLLSSIEEDTATSPKYDQVIPAAVVPLRVVSKKTRNENDNNISPPTSSRDLTKVFKPIEVNYQVIYLFNIRNEGWVCTDEIISTFTSYPSRNVILRLLELLQINIDFLEVDRSQSPFLFTQLDSTNIRLPRMTNSKRIKGVLHLTPLRSLGRLMFCLEVISEEEIQNLREKKQAPLDSNLYGLMKIITSYKPDDEYWVS
ncbi:uncharacterized protein LOC124406606 isoform X4 [Diprion similis]|uniref:uncharacterized protein LOC124406606 isoform X4 n=1 Tax=Diprion similis TaxID=362088 RepID=UPI001EF799C7|nr:uncharacterized protein LOC124406606 isoform X4 [Diprion similis]